MGHKISKEQIDPGVKDHIMSFVGDINELETEDNSNIISAVNSLIQTRVNNIENIEKLANAIGNPVNASDSVDDVVNKVGELTSSFKSKVLNAGIMVNSEDKFKELIDKLEGIEANKQALIDSLIKNGIILNGNESFEELVNMVKIDGYIIRTSDVKQIVCGCNQTFILKNDGSLWSCGLNNYGQLGLGDTTNRLEFNNRNDHTDVKQIACGSDHTFILKNDGSVWSCGLNNYGQLGLGDTTNRNTFTQVTTNINNDVKQIACGSSSAYLLKTDGSLWSCGYNGYGELGLGDATNRNTFTQVTTNINNDVKQIACGVVIDFPTSTSTSGNFITSCYIIKNDGSLWSCGLNNRGQLGLGDGSNRSTFTQVTTNINNDVKEVFAGGAATYIIKTDGSVWSCGEGKNYVLGLGDTNSRNTFTQVTSLGYGEVKKISLYTYPINSTNPYISGVTILKNDGSLWGIGYTCYGQMGLPSYQVCSNFTEITNNINNDIHDISFSYCFHSIILKTDGSLWSCGINSNGQLGLGNTTQLYDYTQTFKCVTTRITF